MKDALLILFGLAALGIGGEWLVRSAVSLGRRAGLSTLVTGLTIVALGTSASELAVSVDAALVGSPGIAIGNVVGSNFANIALVMAISALLMPMDIQPFLLRRDLPVMMLGFAGVPVVLLPDGLISTVEGVLLLSVLLAYVVAVIWVSRNLTAVAGAAGDGPAPDILMERGGLIRISAQLVGGVLLLAFGGHWLVQGGVNIASSLGVSEALIGMTLIAVGTSLPEIVTSVVSILRGHGCLAVGGIVGSNIWNTFGVLGITAVIQPLSQSDVTVSMLAGMAVAGAVLWLFSATGRHINRWEGLALLTGYFVFQALLFH